MFGLRLRAASGKTVAVLSGIPNQSGQTARGPLRFRSLAITVAVVGAAAACGPSVQSIYEGNVRFEHCYRLDLDADIAPTHRQACWNEWLALYTYGQPRDRLEYARRRSHAFVTGDPNTPKLDIGAPDSKSGEARQFYLMVPSPTSVHASPPAVATRLYTDGGVPPTTPVVPTAEKVAPAPQDACTSTCRETFSACTSECESDAGKPPASCKACDPDYKRCMKRCFQ